MKEPKHMTKLTKCTVEYGVLKREESRFYEPSLYNNLYANVYNWVNDIGECNVDITPLLEAPPDEVWLVEKTNPTRAEHPLFICKVDDKPTVSPFIFWACTTARFNEHPKEFVRVLESTTNAWMHGACRLFPDTHYRWTPHCQMKALYVRR